MDVSKKYINLFIKTYSDKLDNNKFDDIQPRFEFARIDDF